MNQNIFFSDINTGKTLPKNCRNLSTSLKCFACIYYHWKKFFGSICLCETMHFDLFIHYAHFSLVFVSVSFAEIFFCDYVGRWQVESEITFWLWCVRVEQNSFTTEFNMLILKTWTWKMKRYHRITIRNGIQQ